jgi:hypothetical protein
MTRIPILGRHHRQPLSLRGEIAAGSRLSVTRPPTLHQHNGDDDVVHVGPHTHPLSYERGRRAVYPP